jgi:uncharacterized protein YqfA (UPF0365 family)
MSETVHIILSSLPVCFTIVGGIIWLSIRIAKVEVAVAALSGIAKRTSDNEKDIAVVRKEVEGMAWMDDAITENRRGVESVRLTVAELGK